MGEVLAMKILELIEKGFIISRMESEKTELMPTTPEATKEWAGQLERRQYPDGDEYEVLVIEHAPITHEQLVEADELLMGMFRPENEELKDHFQTVSMIRRYMSRLTDSDEGPELNLEASWVSNAFLDVDSSVQKPLQEAIDENLEILREAETFKLYMDFQDSSDFILSVDGTTINMLNSAAVEISPHNNQPTLALSYIKADGSMGVFTRFMHVKYSDIHNEGDNHVLELDGEFCEEGKDVDAG